ncbi:MAG: hypothetical protein ACQ5SW_12885 [Sphaerochaetaceae bacterium]
MRNQRITLFFTAILLLGVLISCASTHNSDMDMSDPRREDLKMLYATLEENHPDLYHHQAKQAFVTFYETALQNAPEMSDVEFYFTLSTFVALVGDSHTMVGLPQDLVSSLHALPLQIAFVDDAWRLSVVERNQSSLLGAEVLSLNGIPMQQILDQAKPLVGYDNEVWLRQSIAQQLNITELYAYLGIVNDPLAPFTVTIAQRTGQDTFSFTVTPVSIGEFYQKEYATIYDTPSQTGSARGYYRGELLGNQGEVLFIQYNACVSDPSYSIDQFTEEILEAVSQKRFSQVIVDLRYNGGGNSRLFEPMIDGLGSLQKEQQFKLDVLIGERTFSSALMNAMQFKERTDARLVGTPTGGSVNHFGEVKTFTLPNSGIPVQYSTKRFVMDKNHEGGALQPDVLITPTVGDLLAGVDTTVQAILL